MVGARPLERHGPMRTSPGLRCASCGYDLRGTLKSERCPECGFPVAMSLARGGRRPTLVVRVGRFFIRHYKATGLTALGLAFALGLIESYAEGTRDYYCVSCGRVRWEHATGLCVPFSLDGPCVFGRYTWVGHFAPESGITKFLDPNGECDHRWILNSDYVRGILGPRGPGGRRDVTSAAVSDHPDFPAFLDELPDARAQIVKHLQDRDLRAWITEKFYRWDAAREALDRPDPPASPEARAAHTADPAGLHPQNPDQPD